VLTPTALAVLPPEVLRELETGDITTDIMKIVALVEQIRVQHPTLADAFMKLVIILNIRLCWHLFKKREGHHRNE